MPETTFLVLDYAQEIYDRNTNDTLICSMEAREAAFKRRVERIMERNRRQRVNHRSQLTEHEIDELQRRDLSSE